MAKTTGQTPSGKGREGTEDSGYTTYLTGRFSPSSDQSVIVVVSERMSPHHRHIVASIQQEMLANPNLVKADALQLREDFLRVGGC